MEGESRNRICKHYSDEAHGTCNLEQGGKGLDENTEGSPDPRKLSLFIPFHLFRIDSIVEQRVDKRWTDDQMNK